MCQAEGSGGTEEQLCDSFPLGPRTGQRLDTAMEWRVLPAGLLLLCSAVLIQQASSKGTSVPNALTSYSHL